MRKIKVSIDSPILDTNLDLTHISTSWQVSKHYDFNLREYMLYEELESPDYLLVNRINIEDDGVDQVYARTKYYLKDAEGLIYESDWSNVIPLKSTDRQIKQSNNVLKTPMLRFRLDYTNNIHGELSIMGDGMKMFSGIGNHNKTYWGITDLNGKTIYEVTSEVNLTNITIPVDVIDSDQAFIIKCRYYTDTGGASNYGKLIINANSKLNSLYELDINYKVAPNRWLYGALKIFTANFTSVDVLIKDLSGNTVAEALDQKTLTPKLFTGNLDLYKRYKLYARIKLEDGTATENKFILDFMPTPNQIIPIDTDKTYLNRYTYSQEFLLGGMTTQVVKEYYDGSVIMARHNSNTLGRYIFKNNKLVKTDDLITLHDEILTKPYIDVQPMYDGKLLVNYSLEDSDGVYKKNIMKVFEYNPVNRKMTELVKVLNEDEYYATSATTSLVVMDNNDIYYFPNEVRDVDGNAINKQLKLLDPVTLETKELIDLPVEITKGGTLVRLDENRILFAGGSNEKYDYLIDGRWDIDSWKLTNETIYIYDVNTKLWSEFATLPEDRPEYYATQGFLRADDNVVLFNATDTGPEVGNQRTINIDINNGEVIVSDNDYADNAIYKNKVQLRNGDILNITSRALDPQKVYTYVSDTYNVDSLIDNVSIDLIKELIVPDGANITVEHMIRFDKVRIEGTGLLNWLDDGKKYTFTSKDLIITRNDTIVQNLYDGELEWDTITILDEAELTMSNIIDIPNEDETDFTYEGPIVLDSIHIGEGSSLKITIPE